MQTNLKSLTKMSFWFCVGLALALLVVQAKVIDVDFLHNGAKAKQLNYPYRLAIPDRVILEKAI